MLRGWFLCQSCALLVSSQVLFITGDDAIGLSSLLDNIQALQTRMTGAATMSVASVLSMQSSTTSDTLSEWLSMSTTSDLVEDVPRITTSAVSTARAIHVQSTFSVVARLATTTSSSVPLMPNKSEDDVFTLVQGTNGLFEIAGLALSTSTVEAGNTISSTTNTAFTSSNIPIAALATPTMMTNSRLPRMTSTLTSTMYVTVEVAEDAASLPSASLLDFGARTTAAIADSAFVRTTISVAAANSTDRISPTSLARVAVQSIVPISIAMTSTHTNWTFTATTVTANSNLTTLQSSNLTSDPTPTTAATSAKRVAVSAISSVASVLGLALLCAFGTLLYRRRKMVASTDYGEKSQANAVYGGTTRKTSNSGKMFDIRRFFVREDQVDVYCPQPVFISPPASLVSNPFESDTIAHERLQAQEDRLSRGRSRRSRTSNLSVLKEYESSQYSTDAELPFRLGSPVPADYARPASSLASYRVASWRYRVPEEPPLRTGTRDSFRPTLVQSSLYHARRSLVAIQSRFSSTSSEFGPSMTRAATNFSRPSPPDDRAGQVPTLTSRAVRDRYEAGRMADVSRNSTQARFDTVGRIQLSRPGPRGSDDIQPRDGRQTQVYKLLKRALNR